MRTAIQLAQRCARMVVDTPRLLRESEQLAARLSALQGPGAAAVRAAARHLILALELYQQQQRRLDAEVLRSEWLTP